MLNGLAVLLGPTGIAAQRALAASSLHAGQRPLVLFFGRRTGSQNAAQ